MDFSISIPMIVMILIHCVGLYLHIKIIKISRKEKRMTWKLDITNSCMLMFHHTHCVVMDGITFVVQDLYMYTGEWFCYTSKVIMHYGNLYTAGHSLIVAILKYVIIVQWQKARNMGHERIKETFFWINLLYPSFQISIYLMIRPDFYVVHDGYARIDRCLGDPKNFWGPNSNNTQMKVHNICQSFNEPSHEYYIAYAVYILRNSVCWMQIIAQYLIFWNLVEILIYCRVFSFMRR